MWSACVSRTDLETEVQTLGHSRFQTPGSACRPAVGLFLGGRARAGRGAEGPPGLSGCAVGRCQPQAWNVAPVTLKGCGFENSLTGGQSGVLQRRPPGQARARERFGKRTLSGALRESSNVFHNL